ASTSFQYNKKHTAHRATSICKINSHDRCSSAYTYIGKRNTPMPGYAHFKKEVCKVTTSHGKTCMISVVKRSRQKTTAILTYKYIPIAKATKKNQSFTGNTVNPKSAAISIIHIFNIGVKLVNSTIVPKNCKTKTM